MDLCRFKLSARGDEGLNSSHGWIEDDALPPPWFLATPLAWVHVCPQLAKGKDTLVFADVHTQGSSDGQSLSLAGPTAGCCGPR